MSEPFKPDGKEIAYSLLMKEAVHNRRLMMLEIERNTPGLDLSSFKVGLLEEALACLGVDPDDKTAYEKWSSVWSEEVIGQLYRNDRVGAFVDRVAGG